MFFGVGLAVVILVVAVLLVLHWSRVQIHTQMTENDGDVLAAVASMQYAADVEGGAAALSLEEPAEQMNVLLKTSRLKGVVAARLFDVRGKWITSFPASVREGELAADDLKSLHRLTSISRFHAKLDMDSLFVSGLDPAFKARKKTPLLEVNIPLHTRDSARLLGVAQFYIDGESLAHEFEDIDQQLLLQAGAALLIGGLLLVSGLAWAFRRLHLTNLALMERTECLVKANQELALAAKSSAVGAVSAHLIHGLKSPLFGLYSLIATRALESGKADEPDWQVAIRSARGLQQMVNDISTLLKNERSLQGHEMQLAQVLTLLQDKLQSTVADAGIKFQIIPMADAVLTARDANLVILILENLVRNAIQITPRGREVKVTTLPMESRVTISVQDSGTGVPASMQTQLFAPCESTKPGGLGIGLAISKQLAIHLEAELALKDTGPNGSTFTLTFPARQVQLPAREQTLGTSVTNLN